MTQFESANVIRGRQVSNLRIRENNILTSIQKYYQYRDEHTKYQLIKNAQLISAINSHIGYNNSY